MGFLARLGRGFLWLVGLAAVLGAAIFGGREVIARGNAEEQEARALPVSVIEARYQDRYEERRLFAGRIAPAQVADVAFEVAGEIEEVTAKVGDRVAKGQTLATLDQRRLSLRTEEAAASLADARAQLDRAEASYKRVAELLEQGFATDQERDDALAARNGARERVRLLTRSLERAREDEGDASLRAPFDGFVVARYADAGAILTAGQPVLRLNERGTLEAEIAVPDRMADMVEVGDQFDLLTDEGDVRGSVEGVSGEIDPLTRSRLVRLIITEDPGLSPGSLVRLALTQERSARGVWVPLTALQEGYRGLWSVYVVENEDGQDLIRRKDIEILSLAEERAYVTGTLEDGDRVVETSTFRFVPGQRVRVVGSAPTGAPTSSLR
ncbi:efflux RND transporter periplasmic adaptor subunit [Parvularcula sp. ZS-1/3]|uniref:Efflux RND transporter periplasmic adaptor subunit n=1 Tax=Parvularcula mediterranea TaxID=2732508 RepID=A0A7Y3RM65_9PROT|nr:efflux RND transporter periplasmic adaptor subunit [Parvularcula mediterranea]NNU16155.1 efflux RND transporter periplasmic adaptor subunit [Parvularcula mediterranea]